MIRSILPIFLGAACSIALRAQEAKTLHAHKIPMIVDDGGGFHLCKVKVDGKEAHLLVDSGANMEVTMTKDWATAEGKELKPSSRAADGIARKAELFTATFDFGSDSLFVFAKFQSENRKQLSPNKMLVAWRSLSPKPQTKHQTP